MLGGTMSPELPGPHWAGAGPRHERIGFAKSEPRSPGLLGPPEPPLMICPPHSGRRSSTIGMELFDFLAAHAPNGDADGNDSGSLVPGGEASCGLGKGNDVADGLSSGHIAEYDPSVTLDDISELGSSLLCGQSLDAPMCNQPAPVSPFRTPSVLDGPGLHDGDHFFGSGTCDLDLRYPNLAMSSPQRRGSGALSASSFLATGVSLPGLGQSPSKPVAPVVPIAPVPVRSQETGHIASKLPLRARSGALFLPFNYSHDRESPEPNESDYGSSPRRSSADSAISTEAVVPVVVASSVSEKNCAADRGPTRSDGVQDSEAALQKASLADVLPKVEKPELGDLNGKMPRPVVVNTAPRRRRKNERVSEAVLRREDEARKLKSVQSARDCRRRKKQYIAQLQRAIRQYEDRERVAQRLVTSLRAQIADLSRRSAS